VTRRAFAKYEGLGNDFVVVGEADARDVDAALARALCDRRRGIGADGVLLVLPANDARNAGRMHVINADGSVPEMCGNGLRCVALHVARARGMTKGDLVFETDAGPRACTIDDANGAGMVTVDMGVVKTEPSPRILDVRGESLEAFVADVGNPHAVLFDEPSRARAEAVGPIVEVAFPRGTNVELARLAADGAVDLVVWERGVGITLACGTGACATVAVMCARGMLPRGVPATVRLLGGALAVTIGEGGRATMRGPARHVFSGHVPA
jgi:diaminopimelate epimerase